MFQDEDAALAAVRAGQVDIALTAATLATAQVAGYTVKAVTSVDNWGPHPACGAGHRKARIRLSIGNNVTCNLELRQAIAYAIDRQQVAGGVSSAVLAPLLLGK